MNIIYVIETLAVVGGLEKIIIEKANYLAEKLGYDVCIISCTQNKKQQNAFSLSTKVSQINLSVPYYRQYHYQYPKRLWVKYQIKRQLKNGLEKIVNERNPDIIIGTLKFEAALICQLNTPAKKVIECHEAQPFIMSNLEHTRTNPSDWYVRFYEKRKYFKAIKKKADMVVTLTSGDQKLWQGARRVEVVPNFSNMSPIPHSKVQQRVIAVGRLSAEKGYERLISIWQEVSKRHSDWVLDIFGDGKLHDSLQTLIEQTDNVHITLHHSSPHIAEEYAASDIYVLTSLFEGFSLTLLEAMIQGLPAVAFDCPFGPRCMIDDGKNGFLIKDGDIQLFTEKLCYLIEHPEVRAAFSAAAITKSSYYNKEAIMQRWDTLFISLQEENA